MAVTVWKGHLTFGLVSIPVRLFRAARRERITLHQLHRREPPAPPSMAIHTVPGPDVEEPPEPPVERVRQELFARESEVSIPRSEIVKGYEFEKIGTS